MNNGEIIALLHRIATSLERIANHLDKPEPNPRFELLVDCPICHTTGKAFNPGTQTVSVCYNCHGEGSILNE